MASPKRRLDVCAGRPYTTSNGEEKKHWINVGRLTEWDDGGMSIELHAVPTGNWFDGRLSCFEQEARDQGQGRSQRQTPHREQRRQQTRSEPADDFDDTPF